MWRIEFGGGSFCFARCCSGFGSSDSWSAAVQERRHLMPGDVDADADVGDQVHQQTLAVFAEVLRVHLDADGVGDRNRPVLGDVVLDVTDPIAAKGKSNPLTRDITDGKVSANG